MTLKENTIIQEGNINIKIEKKIKNFAEINTYLNDLNIQVKVNNEINKKVKSTIFFKYIPVSFKRYTQKFATLSWVRFPFSTKQPKNTTFHTNFKNEKNPITLILKYLILKHLTKKYIKKTKELHKLYFNLLNLKTRKPGQEIIDIIDSMVKVILKQQEHIEKMRKKEFTTLNISVKRNNIFASVTNEETKKVKYAVPLKSANQLGLKISKVNTRFYLEEFIEKYFKFIELHFQQKILESIEKNQQRKKKKLKLKKTITFKNKLALNLVCPPKYRNKIIRLFFDYISKGLTQKRDIFLDVRSSKIFNGCRGKKLLRKKRLKIKYLNKHLM